MWYYRYSVLLTDAQAYQIKLDSQSATANKRRSDCEMDSGRKLIRINLLDCSLAGRDTLVNVLCKSIHYFVNNPADE